MMVACEQEWDGRIGPKMRSAVRIVESRGAFQSRNQLAVIVGPHGSQDYGYRIVNRCKKRGLIDIDPDHPEANPKGSGAVVLTEKGQRFYDEVLSDD